MPPAQSAVSAAAVSEKPEGSVEIPNVRPIRASAADLQRANPVYKTMPGWKTSIEKARKLADLPDQAREYLDYVTRTTGVPITSVGVGPDRTQTLVD